MNQEQVERQHRAHQNAFQEQLEICAELCDIQAKLHDVIERLVDRRFLHRGEVKRLIRAIDTPVTALAFDLKKFVVLDGILYAAPALNLPEDGQE